MNASPGAAVGKAVFDSDTAVEWAERGRGRDPGPPGDQPRRPARHDRRPRHPHQPRRQDLARRRRRPRHGPHLRVRRRGPRRRRQGQAVHASAAAPIVARGRRDLDRRHHRRGVPRRGPGGRLRRWCATSRASSVDERPGRTPSTGSWSTPTRVRRLRVRANADTPEDAARARRFGAAGHRPVPHRAHVPRRAPRAGRAA